MAKAAKNRETEGPLPKFERPVEIVAVEKIKVNPNNPRIVRDKGFQKLVRSVKTDPFIMHLRPPIVDEFYMILAGNQRFEAWKACGYKTIPVIRALDLTPEQKNALIIKDNVNVGEWDWDVLSNIFELPQLSEWGMEVPDFNNTEPGAGTESPAKNEIIQYNIIFASKEEYDRFLAWVKELKADTIDPDALISTLILKQIDRWKELTDVNLK